MHTHTAGPLFHKSLPHGGLAVSLYSILIKDNYFLWILLEILS